MGMDAAPGTPSHGPEDTDRHRSSIAVGLILVGLGLALLAERAGHFQGHLVGRLWPLVLVALGLASLANGEDSRRGRGKRRSGAWLVFIGFWGLVSEFHVFGLDFGTSWPLLVVGAGGLLVWKAIDEPGGRMRRER